LYTILSNDLSRRRERVGGFFCCSAVGRRETLGFGLPNTFKLVWNDSLSRQKKKYMSFAFCVCKCRVCVWYGTLSVMEEIQRVKNREREEVFESCRFGILCLKDLPSRIRQFLSIGNFEGGSV